ncbi:MAG: hypothetical protein RLZZ511_3098 [Cyanobacteriota bacterium]
MVVSPAPAKPLAPWSKAVLPTATEFPLTPLPLISGTLPAGLQGSLYRNGPGRLERGGQRMGHWFDGDGAILAVHFANGQARATYRYVQTAGYQAEEQADRLIYGNYGMAPPGPWWQRFGKTLKNVANTSVMVFDDRLWALWEGAQPHRLDLETLATVGLDQVPGLNPKLPYSAHPKIDPVTGEIYNFGVTYGAKATLHLYRHDRQGKLLQQSQLVLPGTTMVHDFALAGNYLVFCLPPLRVNPLPLLLNLKGFSEAVEWQPALGTTILVFDRATLELVSQTVAEPWYQWHFGNGFADQDGNLALDLVRYEDFSTNQFLKEIAMGSVQQVVAGHLYRMRLNPLTGEVLGSEQLSDRMVEFPTVPPAQVAQAARYTYLSLGQDDLLGTIGRYDDQTNTMTIAPIPGHCYGMEPIFVADRSRGIDQGWVLTVVFDSERDCSEVWIFDSEQMAAPPIARLALPQIIPIGFHGTWHDTH